MLINWTQHLSDPEAKTEFERQVKSAIPVLERLGQILDQEVASKTKAELSSTVYDIPNWDYRQAHLNGYKEHHSLVSKLINLDQKVYTIL